MAQAQVPITINAAESFAALARDLRRAGTTGLRKELYSGLQRAARPTLAAVQANTSSLPSGGGRGRRRTRLVDTGETITNTVSGRTHKVKRKVKVRGELAPAESVADRVSKARFTVKAMAGTNPRIRLQASESNGARIDVAALDRGRLRHPLFGRRRHWYTQSIPPGWFTKPIEAKADKFRDELLAAVDAVERQISG